jgi:pyruvate-ferredoxin/flavodoxin oxidoreductase
VRAVQPCSMICPHAAIRTKVFDPAGGDGAPPEFRSVPEGGTPEFEGLSYVVQVAPDDCTGCGLCVEVCPAKDRTRQAQGDQHASGRRAP